MKGLSVGTSNVCQKRKNEGRMGGMQAEGVEKNKDCGVGGAERTRRERSKERRMEEIWKRKKERKKL